jgi:hypothetical protein
MFTDSNPQKKCRKVLPGWYFDDVYRGNILSGFPRVSEFLGVAIAYPLVI